MNPLVVQALINGGLGIVTGVLGMGAEARARAAQEKAAANAEKDGARSEITQAVMDDYALRQSAADNHRAALTRNALLRSYGVQIEDPAFMAPPDLLAIGFGKDGTLPDGLQPKDTPKTLAALGFLDQMQNSEKMNSKKAQQIRNTNGRGRNLGDMFTGGY